MTGTRARSQASLIRALNAPWLGSPGGEGSHPKQVPSVPKRKRTSSTFSRFLMTGTPDQTLSPRDVPVRRKDRLSI
jgi:hypothetical protein